MSPHHTKNSVASQPFSGTYAVWKGPGETLAVLLERFRVEHGLDDGVKLTYAGRLDPMAEGVVLVLAGDDRFKKDSFLRLQKTYEVQVLFGISTDTGDMLGMIEQIMEPSVNADHLNDVLAVLQTLKKLPYPRFSSVPVDGVPLFAHTRAGKSVPIPYKNITIASVELRALTRCPLAECVAATSPVIERVRGDFRQTEIATQWQRAISANPDMPVVMATICTTVSSGTYMRSVAEWIGQQLGVPTLAYRITRMRVGDYTAQKK